MKPGMIIGLGLLVGGALVLPRFMNGPDGRPLSATLDDLKEQAKREESTVSSEQTRQTFQKWQDAQGNWHYGDKVPEGVKAVAVQVDTAANIVRSEKIPEPTADAGAPARKGSVALIEDSRNVTPLTPLTSPGTVLNTVEQAQAVQELLNQHNQAIQQSGQ
ncbi:DUF4124 domain-containing protein [Parathalassolituus penaei]|uniref:DUF4124 domain-containing protein n=1 Tax=Parathalassolituus penaei TaxID=2997323 RepID=A0A9X3EDS6_9GAMM|nr:DUF4124 domain-containing protein [Parathalassolituus penaei]MCY0964954.1 hypothetical protein [Parathalassolituus penaei]